MTLASAAPPSTARVLPVVFVTGWVLLAAGEVLGPVGAPAVPLCVATVAGLLFGSEVGFWSGFLVGGAADLLSGLPVGVQAFAAALVGGGLGTFSLSVSPGSWGAPVLFLALVTVPYRLLLQLLAGLGGAELEGTRGLAESVRTGAWDVGLGLLLSMVLVRMSAGRRPV